MSLQPRVPEATRQFAKNLFATFLGLLMALGLEQWREHRHDVHATQAALEAVQAELKENLERIDRQISRCDRSLATLDQVTQRLDAMAGARRQGRKATPEAMELVMGVSFDLLPDAWEGLKAQGLLRNVDAQRALRLSRFYRAAASLPGMAQLNAASGDLLPLTQTWLAEPMTQWALMPEADFHRLRDGVRFLRTYFLWGKHQLDVLKAQGQAAL